MLCYLLGISVFYELRSSSAREIHYTYWIFTWSKWKHCTKTTLVSHGVTDNLEEDDETVINREDAECDVSHEPHAKGPAPKGSPFAGVWHVIMVSFRRSKIKRRDGYDVSWKFVQWRPFEQTKCKIWFIWFSRKAIFLPCKRFVARYPG